MRTFPGFLIAVFFLTSTVLSLGEAWIFDFKDPKGVNAIGIHLDSLLEPITGVANGISGTVTFDPAKPEATHGKLIVEAASIAMSNPIMTKVLHSEEWIDIAKNPSIEYEITHVTHVEKNSEASWKLTASGPFTLCGVTQTNTVTLTATYLPGKAGERNHKGSGDLLVLRTTMIVDRTKHGIKPDMPPLTVAHDIELNIAIVGTCESK